MGKLIKYHKGGFFSWCVWGKCTWGEHNRDSKPTFVSQEISRAANPDPIEVALQLGKWVKGLRINFTDLDHRWYSSVWPLSELSQRRLNFRSLDCPDFETIRTYFLTAKKTTCGIRRSIDVLRAFYLGNMRSRNVMAGAHNCSSRARPYFQIYQASQTGSYICATPKAGARYHVFATLAI